MVYRASLSFTIDDQAGMTEEMVLQEAKRKLVVMSFTRRWPGLTVAREIQSGEFVFFDIVPAPSDVLDAEVIRESKPTFEPKQHSKRTRRLKS